MEGEREREKKKREGKRGRRREEDKLIVHRVHPKICRQCIVTIVCGRFITKSVMICGGLRGHLSELRNSI